MKKQIALVTSLLTLLGASGVLAFSGLIQKDKEVKAYTTASLPTTIDLNDCSDSTIRNYYSSLNSLGNAQKQGQNLLKNLKTVLSNGQKYFAYDSVSGGGSTGNDIWSLYEISDRDWEKSPASAITYGSYNPSTNKITGYEYGYGKNNPYVHSLYTNRNVDNQARAFGDHTQTNWGINREHLWPKSQGFKSEGAGGARGDPMHLWSGNGYVNNIHSNYYYGNVGNVTTDCGSTYSFTSGNYLGTSASLGYGTVFEPQDSDKGDIARSIFYMVARYNNIAGNDNNINQDNPNLTLDDSPSTLNVDSTATYAVSLGILHDLLEWHKLDPVDEYEIHRNNLLYVNYTNNRNPFIDFPEWADYIWGTPESNMSYSSPTGYANPNSDTINGYKNSVLPTAITLSTDDITIQEGDTFSAFVASVTPSNASSAVNWSSSNTGVATVTSAGVIAGVHAGTATITATSKVASNVSASISVTVVEKEVTGFPYINGLAYKFYMNLNNVKNYFNGQTGSQSYYGATSTTYSDGVYVYFENNGDGKSMYFMSGSTKKYVSIVVATSGSSTYRNFNIGTSTPTYPWYYDDSVSALYALTGNSTKYFLGLKTNTTYTTFGAFSASSIGTYMLVEDKTADVFSYKFLNKITCDATGNTAPSYASGYSWNNFNSLYSDLHSAEQNLLLNASANTSGTNIEKAMARYDFICRKYHYNNFISRSTASGARLNLFMNSNQNNMLIIIISVSFFAVSGFAVYLIIKKKKQNH